MKLPCWQWKRETTEGIELQNQEKIGIVGEKENHKTLWKYWKQTHHQILEADTPSNIGSRHTIKYWKQTHHQILEADTPSNIGSRHTIKNKQRRERKSKNGVLKKRIFFEPKLCRRNLIEGIDILAVPPFKIL